MRCNQILFNGLASLTLLSSVLLIAPAAARAQKVVLPLPAASAAPVPAQNGASAATAAEATATPPRIVFGGIPFPVASPQAAPFRDTVDSALCVTPESLAPLGITYIVDEMMGKVSLLGPDGVVTVTTAVRTPPAGSASKGVFIPLVEVVEGLGGKCEWTAATSTLHVRAKLLDAVMSGGQLRVRATFPVTPKITTAKGGRQIIVDIPGAEVGALPKQLTLIAPGVSSARSGQFDDDTARIVLEMTKPSGFIITDTRPTTQIVLNPSLTIPAAAPKIATAKTGKTSKAALPASSLIKGVLVKNVSAGQAQILISANRAPGVRVARSRGRLTFDLLNTTLGANAAAALGAEHPLLKAVQLAAPVGGSARLILDLARAVNYTVKPLANGTLLVDLVLPKNAGGKLAGKLIAVDAGHGGHDGGARGLNGTYEKNVNLAIANQVAATLRDQGANVLMTRASDTYIEVNERPRIANRAGADFFLSIHADSGGSNRRVSGSTVYYHMDWASCRTLAQCIADRFSEMGTIRSKGPHSDGMQFGGRFVNGYGVLRGSRMVAVLVECGYMSNSSDVRNLNDKNMQKRIAGSIVAGLRDYIEGNPDFDTRFINPKAVGGLPEGAPAIDDTTAVVPPEVLPAGAVQDDDDKVLPTVPSR